MSRSTVSEKELLLPAEEQNNAEMKRNASARFQVSRSEQPEESGAGDCSALDVTLLVDAPPINDSNQLNTSDRTKSGSEPPFQKNGNSSSAPVARKMSATGRFMVLSDNASQPLLEQNSELDVTMSVVTKLDEIQVDIETEEPAPMSRSRGVHFSVGERDMEVSVEHTLKKREPSQDNNTTLNMKSWRNMKTIEHPPIIDFYRNSVDIDGVAVRPSMAQLIHGQRSIPEEIGFEDLQVHNHELVDSPNQDAERKMTRVEKFKPPQAQTRVKFGWVQGVFVRCLLNIFGVMLYLRISWVAGQAGIGLGSMIVLLASLVTTITAISTCAICTNGDVKGGGAYFLISRSLGPEFGGSIGLIFSVANAVGAAMYIVGFAETVRDLLREFGFVIFDGQMWDVRVIGFVTCVLLMGIVFIGTEFESKMQMGLLVILMASIANYFVGSILPPNEQVQRRGATGYSLDTMRENFFPAFRDGEDFFSVFAVYFPAATGIMAGANISGDLADPQKAIPIGTLLAIAVTTVIYLMTVWMTGSTCVRDADGINLPMWNGSSLVEPLCATNGSCPYGLMNYFQVMEMESFWGPLITAGIFAATLSSALASLVSAPKVFQAVCKDRLFPKIGYFAKGFGKNEEPRRAYVLGFLLAFAMIAIGDLNAIAPIISNFFLCSYALINYACFDQSFADSPGFRPGFKYYNMWVSLAGAILCVVVMFIISWWTALVTFFCFGALFMYILHRKPDVNWGSSTQAHSYKNALAGMIKLANTEEHVKNYRPQFLVLSGNPASRPSLVDFAYNISKGTSLMVCGYVVPYNPSDRVFSVIRRLERQLSEWLRKRKVKSFFASVANPSLRLGVQSLLQLGGLSKLRPNILLLGFKQNWHKGGTTQESLDDINDYFGTIQDAFDCNVGVCVLRNSPMGLDFSEAMKQLNVGDRLVVPDVDRSRTGTTATGVSDPEKESPEIDTKPKEENEKKDDSSSTNSLAEAFAFDDDEHEEHEYDDEDEDSNEKDANGDVEKGQCGKISDDERRTHHTFSLRRRNSRRPTMEQKALLTSISRFQRKVKKGVIDVWWLYDDGGLTLLIPHLLTIPKSYLEGSRLRVFTISTSSRTMEQEQRGMAALLSKFRINFSDVSVIADIGKRPRAETMLQWERVIEPFIALDDGECPNGMTTMSELSAQREKTYRQLRAGELLQQHSMNADLIVMTLPVPRKGLVSASLYLSWLDVMTRGLPPTLLVRGNQQSVLTFYS